VVVLVVDRGIERIRGGGWAEEEKRGLSREGNSTCTESGSVTPSLPLGMASFRADTLFARYSYGGGGGGAVPTQYYYNAYTTIIITLNQKDFQTNITMSR